MKSELAAYQSAGQKVTLGLGLQDPPSWVINLSNSPTPTRRATPPPTPTSCSPRRPLRRGQLPRPGAAKLLPFSPSPPSGSAPAPATARCSTPATVPTGPSARRPDRQRPARRHDRNPDPAGARHRRPDPGPDRDVGDLVHRRAGQRDRLADANADSLGFTGTTRPSPPVRAPARTTSPRRAAEPDRRRTTGVGAVWNRYYAQLPTNNTGSSPTSPPSPTSPAATTAARPGTPRWR